jgi:secreted PhoX family phosphatase
MTSSRREFLRRSISTGFLLGLDQLTGRIALGTATSLAAGFGPLQPTRADDTGELLLALPAGFRYRVLRRAGQPMTDGSLTPSNPDGMAAFAVDGRIRLVRNHEISDQGLRISLSAPYYDLLARGGVTILELDPLTNQVLRDFVALSGTVRNCSGGTTPWGSWISCEETTTGSFAGFPRPHGYCFEVPASANDAVPAVPLRAMGRFLHEAVAVDPATGIVYLTEDRPEAGLYRFVPDRRGQLAAGGILQMLAIRERPHYDTRHGQVRGVRLPVEWVDIGNPDPENAEFDPSAVYRQGSAKGGATFIRLEGATFTSSRIVFTATTGGNQGLGQIWELRVRNARSRAVGRGPRGVNETLTLLFESSSAAILKAPDNLCVSTLGSLVLCEDSAAGHQFLRVFNPAGEVFDLARNIMPGFESSEFAGATFSPDGRTLFVNMYLPGLTVAISVPPL